MASSNIPSQLPSYGVVDLDDKARLTKLIKLAAAEWQHGQKGGLSQLDLGQQLDGNAGLLDLDAHDGDLLSHAGFQMSPLGNGKGRPQNGVVGPAGSVDDADPPKIVVVVRKRPMNRKEADKGEDDIVDANSARSFVTVNETKLKVDLTKYVEKHQFNFDVTLDETVTNDHVYRTTVMPLVPTLFKAGKATCFAYGQTGSGKTHTMSPLPIRAAADILQYLAMPQHSDVSLLTSCFEIYGNKCFDLLNDRKKLNILEDGKKRVVVVGLKEFSVTNVDVVKHLIEKANQQRSVGSTAANADSSRSHSIMQFALKKPSADGGGHLVGKISFIDLAGSERGADTYDNNRQTRLEGAEINKSLLALKECIRALDSDARHVPFRGSKLTAVLRDSFVGDQARTVMIANISPNSTSVEHTLNTLRYADRVKELRKDKADRTAGGVTPGEAPGYYAAVQRAVHAEPSGRPAGLYNAPFQPPASAPAAAAAHHPRGPSPPRHAARPLTPPAAAHVNQAIDDEELINARDELMNTILEEEEDLIHVHRAQIEDSMELVRQEMQLLTDVDQPGSAIDQYVAALEGILNTKLENIMLLKEKLDSFKSKLKEEEILSKTMSNNNLK